MFVFSAGICVKSLQQLHVVAGEGAEAAAALRGADEPAVVAFLQHVHGVAVVQLQLVAVLRPVRVDGTIAAPMADGDEANGFLHYTCVISGARKFRI